MFVIPFRVNETQYSLYVGFDDDSMARMKNYDPGELVLDNLPLAKRGFDKLQLKDIIFGYCSEEDGQHALKLMKEADDAKPGLQYLTRGWQYLTRGWQFRPDRGDHDGPAVSLPSVYTEPIPEYGDVMTVSNFRDMVTIGAFVDYDGVGNASDGKLMAKDRISPSTVDQIPQDATHIVWFNK